MKNESILIAVTMHDGSVQITNMLTQGRGDTLPSGAVWYNDGSGWWYRKPTKEVIESEITKGCGPGWASWRRIEAEAIVEKDRMFRAAWRDNGSTVAPDLVLSREVKRGMIRKERKQILRDLDGEWMRAVGTKDTAEAARVEAERQKWRDAPADPRIEAATSVEELKQIKAV